MREMFFGGIVWRGWSSKTSVGRTMITLFVSACPIRSTFIFFWRSVRAQLLSSIEIRAIVIVCARRDNMSDAFLRNATSERSATRASSWHGYLSLYQGSARALSMQMSAGGNHVGGSPPYLLHDACNLAELFYTVTSVLDLSSALHGAYLCVFIFQIYIAGSSSCAPIMIMEIAIFRIFVSVKRILFIFYRAILSKINRFKSLVMIQDQATWQASYKNQLVNCHTRLANLIRKSLVGCAFNRNISRINNKISFSEMI